MTYYVIEIVTSEGATAKQITEKTDIDEARMLFHQILSAAYANQKVTYAQALVLDEYGSIMAQEIKRVVEPEPEEE